jgi:hypothetical protein
METAPLRLHLETIMFCTKVETVPTPVERNQSLEYLRGLNRWTNLLLEQVKLFHKINVPRLLSRQPLF